MEEKLLVEILEELRKINLQNKKVYTTEELAELVSTYPNKINAWRQAGLITGIKKGRGWVFSNEEVNKFLKKSVGKDISQFR